MFCIISLACLSAKSFVNNSACYKIEYPDYFGNKFTIPEDNQTTEQGVFLGRVLFYETALSGNNRMSCATCHQQKHAFTDGKRFSAGFDNTLQPRNTMSLANLLWVRHFFWDGRSDALEKQAATPMTGAHEMGQAIGVSAKKLKVKKFYASLFLQAFGSDTITGEGVGKALAQFERTLVSANSRYDKYLRGQYDPSPSELNGISLFYTNPDPAKHIRGAGCGQCHGGPKTYSELFHNNGLDSVAKDHGRENITGQSYDRGRFRTVTLRNIALTAPYMHDGRFNTLQEVISHYNEHIIVNNTVSSFIADNSNTTNGINLDLNGQEKNNLIAFLNMLTDSAFITDKHFSNPFSK